MDENLVREYESLIVQMCEVQNRYNAALNDMLAFKTGKPFRPTLWQRIKWPVQDFAQRVRNAWLVLSGRADITDD